MSLITGLILKKEGTVIVTDGRKTVIKWTESCNRKRTFYYLVSNLKDKYTKPYRLKSREIDYWIKKLTYINKCYGDEKW